MRFLILFFSLNVFAVEKINVVVYSDSMGAGVFAGSDGIRTKDVEYADREGSLFRKFLLWAVEDHGSNWATGDVDYSIVSRIKRLGFSVDAFNASLSGATASDVVNSEIPKVSAWIKNKEKNLAIVFIGGNDICDTGVEGITSSDSFSESYKIIADNVKDYNAKVFVPLPDLTALYELKDKRCFLGFKCSKIWEFTKNCLNITRNQNLPLISSKIMEYNEIIKREADRVNAMYINEVDMYRFRKEHVSRIDSFHPSRDGQELISIFVWKYLGEKQ